MRLIAAVACLPDVMLTFEEGALRCHATPPSQACPVPSRCLHTLLSYEANLWTIMQVCPGRAFLPSACLCRSDLCHLTATPH